MAVSIITQEDLQVFKTEMVNEFRKILKEFQPDLPTYKKWLKSYEVRKMLNISPGTLQTLRINGSLPFTKIGGTMFYEHEDVKKMMNINKGRL